MRDGTIRPMRRRLFTLASLLSLLLCLVTVVLWVRSYKTWYAIDWFRTDADIELSLYTGSVIYRIAPPNPFKDPGFSWESETVTTTTAGGFGYIAQPVQVYWFPAWLIVIVFACPIPFWLMQFWRSRRERGSCRQCGYSLTGNTSGVCPECGTALKISN